MQSLTFERWLIRETEPDFVQEEDKIQNRIKIRISFLEIKNGEVVSKWFPAPDDC